MEEFVYIILVVVWLLVSFLKRKKPRQPGPAPDRKPKPREQEAPPGEEVSMEDLLEEFLGGKKKKKEETATAEPRYQTEERRERPDRERNISRRGWEETPAEAEVEEAYAEHTGKAGVDEDFEFTSGKDDKGAIGKVQTVEELIRMHAGEEARARARAEEEEAGLHAGLEDFDLRTAVIFSEILNRKDH